MNEIKIRFYGYGYFGHEMWEIFSGKVNFRRFLVRDTSGPDTPWLTGEGPECEPGFPVKDVITLILCDHDWNEQTRTGNDRARFPDEFPTLIDACRQAWNDYSPKPQRLLDTPGLREWLSQRMPAGLNRVEQDNWLDNSAKPVKREVIAPFDFCGQHLAIIRQTLRHTHCRLLWREYFAGTAEPDEDGYETNYHFYGHEVGNYVIGTNPLQIANLPYRVQRGETELSITAKDLKAFNALIGHVGKSAYRSRDPKMKHLICVLKEQAAIRNAGLTPHIDKTYYCATCGSRSGKCHPDTGYCFLCDTDNWTIVNPWI